MDVHEKKEIKGVMREEGTHEELGLINESK
jgi:hypothetical protein